MKTNDDNWRKELILIIITLLFNYLFFYYIQKNKCIVIR
jgi:hypothetical protein